MVKDALRKAPRSFTLWARDGNPKHDIHIGPGRAHFGPGPTCTHFIDPETLERRPYTKADVPMVARLVDALPNIDFCESLGTVSDVHFDLGALYEFAGMFPNTSKPIVAWSYDRYDSAGIHEIAVSEAGGQRAFEQRPNYVHYCEPLSPLVSTFEAIDKLIFAATHRVPLVFTPCPIAGGTAPITGAGIITMGAAESWMGLTLAQTLQPGLPATWPCCKRYWFTATAYDKCANANSASVYFYLGDKVPPVISSVTASPDTLWPPNHQMVEVQVTVAATDNLDPAPVSRITAVTCNEPADAPGGNSPADWEITGDLTLRLRAERAGDSTSRVYTINVVCTDACGNSTTGSVDVTVPHDKGM
jgi:hypothetical protein